MKEKIFKIISIVGGYFFGCEIGILIALLPGLYWSSAGQIDEGFGGLFFTLFLTLPLALILSQILGIGLAYFLFRKTKKKLENGRFTNYWATFLVLILVLTVATYFLSSSDLFGKLVSPLIEPSVVKCQKLNQASDSNQLDCYMKVVRFEKNSQACSHAPNVSDWSVRDSCYFYFATENKNINDCKYITNTERRHDCYSQIGAIQEVNAENEKCQKIQDGEEKEKCFSEI